MSKSRQEEIRSDWTKWFESSWKGDEYEDFHEWVKDMQLDHDGGSISWKADWDLLDEFPVFSLLLPETYPKGEYQFIDHDGQMKIVKGVKSLGSALDKLLREIEEKREICLKQYAEDDDDEMADEDDGDGMDDDDEDEPQTPYSASTPHTQEFYLDEDIVSEKDKVYAQIDKDLAQVNKTGGWLAERGPSGMDHIRLYLFLDPRKRLGISDLVANCWGIDLDKFVTLTLTFSSFYLDSTVPPQVECFQSGNTLNPKELKLEKKSKFGLQWTCENRIREEFFKKFWPVEKFSQSAESRVLGSSARRNYMEGLLAFIENTIKKSPSQCLICGQTQKFDGLKPTVCDKQLCVFSHESYGLGVDLETVVRVDSVIVDLLITLTYAACNAVSAQFNPFDPFPQSLEIKVKESSGAIKTNNFLSGGGEKNNDQVRKVIELIPTVDKLRQWSELGKLKENCDALHPLMYSLLRWIMASNRAHLKKLDKNEQIKEMQTEHQYIMMSSTPEKEKEFQELKAQHGSVYAFHGSPLCNWHSIMRLGLKNMSGKKGQLNGAAYGSGVYLAANSNVSVGYMRYQSGWRNSMFASYNMACLAVCEIALGPELRGQPNPYYVVANEKLLQTRYLLVYTQQPSCSVEGKNLKPPKIQWS